MGRLEDRIAFITGAAGGIGAATARRFVEEGAAVMCADLNDEAGEKLVSELTSSGARARYVNCDVSDPAAVRSAIDACAEAFGGCDVLFNNAATSTAGYVGDLDLDGWDHSLRVMLSASLYGMQAALPYMLERGRGSIVNTSSIYGIVASPGVSPYTTAKAGLINLTRTAAIEYARKNIRVNAICPGVVDTPMFEATLSVGLRTRAEVEEMHPIGRVIEPEEIANLALFLACDESSAITGQAIVIDGGLIGNCNLTGMPPVS